MRKFRYKLLIVTDLNSERKFSYSGPIAIAITTSRTRLSLELWV